MSGREITEQIVELLYGWAGPNETITPDTSINWIVDGDDADEFLKEVVGRFGTSFEGFDFRPYFTDEGVEPLMRHWALKLGFNDYKRPLTVRHLAKVVERGRWFGPPVAQ
jgi:hypothetical protein